MRVVDGLFLALAIGGAAYVYDVKHQAEEAHDTRRGLEREIGSLSRDVSLLEADLAALEQPARLQGLVASLPEAFNLEPIAARHYVRLSDIPFRVEEVEDPQAEALGTLADQGLVSDLDTLIESLMGDVERSEDAAVPADDIGRLLEGVQ
jgi:hypothetical protein